jgi:hypothetical protein
MQQRRPRLGDVLDDYCPRERRVTNHAVVAMVDDAVKQTRCTTCDTEHEYKKARVPTLRRKKDAVSTAYQEVLSAVTGDTAPGLVTNVPDTPPTDDARAAAAPVLTPPEPEPLEATEELETAEIGGAEGAEAGDEGQGRVHRRLIRATLPRTENHQATRPVPEFTMRQPAARSGSKFRGMTRPAGGRPGPGRPLGHGGGSTRTPIFTRPAGRGGQGTGRVSGRNDVRLTRGGQAPRHGKKHSK